MERLAELAIITRNGLDNSAVLASRHGDPCCGRSSETGAKSRPFEK
jgi:hypothetical protein